MENGGGLPLASFNRLFSRPKRRNACRDSRDSDATDGVHVGARARSRPASTRCVRMGLRWAVFTWCILFADFLPSVCRQRFRDFPPTGLQYPRACLLESIPGSPRTVDGEDAREFTFARNRGTLMYTRDRGAWIFALNHPLSFQADIQFSHPITRRLHCTSRTYVTPSRFARAQ